MADAQLEILFKIVADKVGADEANRLMAGLKRETVGAGEEAHKFNIKGHEMRELMHAMNRIAPGLGLALKAAFNPELIGILGLVVLVDKLAEALKNSKEEAAKAAKEMSASFIAAAAVVADFHIKVKEANAAFLAEYKAIYDAQTSLTAGIDAVTGHIKDQKEELLLLSKARGEDEAHRKEIEVGALEATAKAALLTAVAAKDRYVQSVATRGTAEQAFRGPEGDELREDIKRQKEFSARWKAELEKGEGDPAELSKSIAAMDEAVKNSEAKLKALNDAFDAAKKVEIERAAEADKARAAVGPAGRAAEIARAGLQIEQSPGVSEVISKGVEAIGFARDHAGKVSQEQGQAIAGLHGFLEAIGMANQKTIEMLMKGQQDAIAMARNIDRLNKIANSATVH